MKYLLTLLIVLLAGCASAPKHEVVVTAKRSPNSVAVNETEVTLTSNGDEFDAWSKPLQSGLCSSSFTATIDKIYRHPDGDSFAKVMFANDTIGKDFSILFYSDPSSQKIQTLIWHSDDDGAELFGREFDVNQDITTLVMIGDSADFTIAVEPKASIDELFGGTGTKLKGDKFEANLVDVGFIPERVTLQAYGVDATFRQVRINEGC